MNNLQITNSLSNKKEIFIPINPKKISLYVCGPTVYDDPHVGNGRALVVFDLLYRVLIELFGKDEVAYVRNITDIDDKIIEQSNKTKKSISELTLVFFISLIHQSAFNLLKLNSLTLISFKQSLSI